MNAFCQYVENEMMSAVSDPHLAYAGNSFLKSCAAFPDDELSAATLQRWIIDMIDGNLKLATRKRYFSKMHALYNAWRHAPGNDPFLSVGPLLNYDSETGRDRAVANLALAGRMIRRNDPSLRYDIYAVFLYLLYNPQATLADVAALRFSDTVPDISQLDELRESMRYTTRKKYVFGLDQGKKRQPQILRELLQNLHSALRLSGFRFGEDFSRDSITSIWIAAAMKAGLSPAEIRTLVSRIPEEYSYLKYIVAEDITPLRRQNLLQKVADSINDKSAKWHIMRLRQGRTLEDITDRIADYFGEDSLDISFYYPMHTVVHLDKKSKKKVRKEEPFLPGILFFKMRSDRVGTLFRAIGDLAWCYRFANTPDSPYCTISSGEMRAFQKHIGMLSPDIRIELVERDEPFAVGSVVQINGGGRMEGYVGVIQSVKSADGLRTYTLRISENEALKWTVKDLDEIYVTPVNEN